MATTPALDGATTGLEVDAAGSTDSAVVEQLVADNGINYDSDELGSAERTLDEEVDHHCNEEHACYSGDVHSEGASPPCGADYKSDTGVPDDDDDDDDNNDANDSCNSGTAEMDGNTVEVTDGDSDGPGDKEDEDVSAGISEPAGQSQWDEAMNLDSGHSSAWRGGAAAEAYEAVYTRLNTAHVDDASCSSSARSQLFDSDVSSARDFGPISSGEQHVTALRIQRGLLNAGLHTAASGAIPSVVPRSAESTTTSYSSDDVEPRSVHNSNNDLELRFHVSLAPHPFLPRVAQEGDGVIRFSSQGMVATAARTKPRDQLWNLKPKRNHGPGIGSDGCSFADRYHKSPLGALIRGQRSGSSISSSVEEGSIVFFGEESRFERSRGASNCGSSRADSVQAEAHKRQGRPVHSPSSSEQSDDNDDNDSSRESAKGRRRAGVGVVRFDSSTLVQRHRQEGTSDPDTDESASRSNQKLEHIAVTSRNSTSKRTTNRGIKSRGNKETGQASSPARRQTAKHHRDGSGASNRPRVESTKQDRGSVPLRSSKDLDLGRDQRNDPLGRRVVEAAKELDELCGNDERRVSAGRVHKEAGVQAKALKFRDEVTMTSPRVETATPSTLTPPQDRAGGGARPPRRLSFLQFVELELQQETAAADAARNRKGTDPSVANRFEPRPVPCAAAARGSRGVVAARAGRPIPLVEGNRENDFSHRALCGARGDEVDVVDLTRMHTDVDDSTTSTSGYSDTGSQKNTVPVPLARLSSDGESPQSELPVTPLVPSLLYGQSILTPPRLSPHQVDLPAAPNSPETPTEPLRLQPPQSPQPGSSRFDQSALTPPRLSPSRQISLPAAPDSPPHLRTTRNARQPQSEQRTFLAPCPRIVKVQHDSTQMVAGSGLGDVCLVAKCGLQRSSHRPRLPFGDAAPPRLGNCRDSKVPRERGSQASETGVACSKEPVQQQLHPEFTLSPTAIENQSLREANWKPPGRQQLDPHAERQVLQGQSMDDFDEALQRHQHDRVLAIRTQEPLCGVAKRSHKSRMMELVAKSRRSAKYNSASAAVAP